MNKIAPIAFILLLSCGAALWFLASDSLNFYIKSQLQTLGSTLSQQNVSVENVSIRTYQGSGTITHFSLNGSTTPSSNVATPTLNIASIDLLINRESLKKEVIIIDSVIIHGLVASYSETGTNLNHLLATVQSNIKQKMLNASTGDEKLKKTKLPLLKVSKVIIKSAILKKADQAYQQISTEILPVIEWSNIGSEKGLSGEELGIKIFEQVLIELSKKAKPATTT